MDREPSEGSPSPSSGSQRRARKRPWNDPDDDVPSSGSSEKSSHPPTQPDTLEPGSDGDGASSSRVPPLVEEDSKRPTENPVTQWKSRGKDKKHSGLLALSAVGSLSGCITGQTLDFRLPCTATEDTACQIVGHLSAWNEFLCLASWKLQEMPGTSAELSLVLLTDLAGMYCLSQELHLATLLVGQLLNTHHCVSHVEFYVSDFEANIEILSDALQGNPSIKSVRLEFSGWVRGEDLAAAALSLPRLQELEYSGSGRHSPTLVARLSTYLQTTTSLSALRISKERWAVTSCEDFFKGLGQNSSLKELVLPSCLIAEAPPSALAAFTEWLTNSVSLKSLTVASDVRGGVPLKCILGAILENRSIVAMLFDSLQVDKSDVEFISKIFEENKVLRSFKISYKFYCYSPTPFSVRECLDKADCDRCLKALIGNHTLEEVALPIDIWDEGQWKELFEALPAKRNLKKVSIEAVGMATPFLVGKLCTALKETGADEKVSFSASFTEKEFDERCACKSFSSVVMRASEKNKATLYGILERMPFLAHITCLYVSVRTVNGMDRALASVLATFLKATRTLKALRLAVSLDQHLYDYQEVLMDGMAHNTSLREVRIDVLNTTHCDSTFQEPLAEVIKASKNISKVNLYCPGCGEHAFFRSLSTGIADNYTLLSVIVRARRKIKKPWFTVWDVTRRNCGLLTNAADFARGARRNRRCAEALERMHSHLELVEEVARLEGVEEARAAAMVRNGLRSMEGLHDFMRLVGVVQERVSCHAREDGRMQLDALNEDCWKAVRGYLKLRDVKDGME